MEKTACKRMLSLFVMYCFVFYSVSGEDVEKSILLEFKSSLSDPDGILSTWRADNTSKSHCAWFGVTCNSNSKVVSLNITGGGGGGGGCKGNDFHALSCSKTLPFSSVGSAMRRARSNLGGILKGKLSPFIGNLSELRVVSLPCNELSGEIPLEIWGMEKLEVLDLEGNSFAGRLPHGFVGSKELRILNLGFNRLEGEIPISLSKYAGLEVLNLSGNKLKGTIPGFIGAFNKLRRLYLANTQLNGSIPGVLGSNCRYLEYLDLSGNFLTGEIPSSLADCRQLRVLLLFLNMLSGVIPRELGQLKLLEVLDVSRNSIRGAIPAELGNCTELSVLVLSSLFQTCQNEKSKGGNISDTPLTDSFGKHNYFGGSIPLGITTLPKLKLLWAPGAGLDGKLPSNWGDCAYLRMVNLAQNAFHGGLTGVFEKCKNLYFLDLSTNKLRGKLNRKLQVPCMAVFDISGNYLSGSIPKFYNSSCPYVPSLDSDFHDDPAGKHMEFFAYMTRLASHLPFSLANFTIMHNFRKNNFTGPVSELPISPERFGEQVDYAFLISENQFTGSLLESLFGKCNKLHGVIVDISKNMISSSIPMNIGRTCKSLRLFNASQNQISGSVPHSFGDLKSLVTLDLSGNKLQDQIPVSLGRVKRLKYLSLASNNLSGPVPASFGGLQALEILQLSENALSGRIPPDIIKLDNLKILLLDYNRFSGPIPSGLADMPSLAKIDLSWNNLSGAFPVDGKVINCSVAIGNPLLSMCHIVSFKASPPEVTDKFEVGELVAPSESESGKAMKSVEIASIVSAAAVVCVLLVLVILFFCTKKRSPQSRVQVSEQSQEPKEIKVFVDIGVPLLYENIVQATGGFNGSNCIGSGGFGATYRAEISPSTVVAIKRLAVGRFHCVQQFHAEIKALGRVRHPNLITLIGYHASEAEMFLIYNYLPGGNLENFIKQRSSNATNWKILHKIALHIGRALAYLHDQCSPRVLHRDVKPSNILLDNEFNAYLSDFGLSRLLLANKTHTTTGVAGTYGYVAPEYAMTCRVSEKADVYSYGVVLLELISDKKALDPSFSTHENGYNIVSWACMLLRNGKANDVFNAGLWESGPHNDLVDMLHLAVACTVETLSTRPTMKQVVRRLIQIQPP